MDAKLEDAKTKGEAAGRLKEKIEIAKKQLRRGVALKVVVEDTGLTIEEIKASTSEDIF